jgi:hypothetical protein
MRKVWPWLAGLIAFLVLGWIILFGSGFLQNRGYLLNSSFTQQDTASNYWHHRGFGMRWGLPYLGILGGLLFLIIPGGLIALIVLGIYLLVRPNRKNENQVDEGSLVHCTNCGEEVEPGWHVCPYCGENLGKD